MTIYERFLEFSGKAEDFIMDSLFGLIIAFVGVCIVLFVIIFGLAWIFSDKTDHGQCLQSHTETYQTYVYVNKVMVPTTNYHNVCDLWEYPVGRG